MLKIRRLEGSRQIESIILKFGEPVKDGAWSHTVKGRSVVLTLLSRLSADVDMIGD